MSVELYKVQPNIEGGLYYYETGLAGGGDFEGWLSQQEHITLTENSYDINDDILRVSGTQTGYKYIKWKRGSGKPRYYHITTETPTEGYTTYNLRLDEWGTYISSVQFTNTRVTRTNRNVGNTMIYDPIAQTETTPEFVDLWTHVTEPTKNDIAILFTVNTETNTGVSLIPSSSSCETRTFAIRLLDVPTAFKTSKTLMIDAMRVISGIYAYNTIVGDREVLSQKASVISAAFVPFNAISFVADYSYTATNNPVFQTKVGADTYSIDAKPIRPDYITKSFELTIDPNYEYIVGTRYNGIKIPRFANKCTILYEFITKTDGLTVNVKCGNLTKDITNDFTLPLTVNGNLLSPMERLTRTIGTVASAAGTVASIAPTGTIAGAIPAALGGLASLTGASAASEGQAIITGGGDGYITFYRGTVDGVETFNYPYAYRKYKSVSNERTQYTQYGCQCNYFYDSATLNILLSTPAINDTTAGITPFIALESYITGAPTGALETIKNLLAKGIWIKQT